MTRIEELNTKMEIRIREIFDKSMKDCESKQRIPGSDFFMFDFSNAIHSLTENGDLHNYNVNFEDDKLLIVLYQIKKYSGIESMEIKDLMREYKIDELLK